MPDLDYSSLKAVPSADGLDFSKLKSPEPVSFAERVLHGFAEPFVGLEQLGAKLGVSDVPTMGVGLGPSPYMTPPSPDETYKATQQFQKGFEQRKEEAGQGGFDWAELLGNAANPLNYVVGGGPASSLLGRLGAAALSGAGAALFQPVGEGNFAGEKGKQLATGAATGGVLQGLGEGFAKVAKPVLEGLQTRLPAIFPEASQRAATKRLAGRIEQDVKAGGPSVSDIRQSLASSNKPLSIPDVAGKNVLGLGGTVIRAKGAAKEKASLFFNERDSQAYDRMINDIDTHVSNGGNAYDVIQSTMAGRKAASDPVYEEALKPGSTAPLQQQFEEGYRQLSSARADVQQAEKSAQTKVTLATAKLQRAGNDVYASSAAHRELAAANAELQAARTQMASLSQKFRDMHQALSDAQEAAAAGERGGVWSLYLNRLWKHEPEIRRAMNVGLRIQRLEANAKNIPYDPKDFAIVGADESGNPIVGKVPNMRTWDAAKKGLDAMIEAHRDKVTGVLHSTEEVRALTQLRSSLVSELDRLNPSYAEARLAWSGPSEALSAIEKGKEFARMNPDQIPDIVKKLGSNKDFFLLGVADRLRHLVAKVQDSGRDPSLPILHARRFLRPLFDSDKALDDFENAALKENLMRRTRQALAGGSQTAGRISEDVMDPSIIHDLARLGIGAAALSHGEPLYGIAMGTHGFRGIVEKLSRPTESVRDALGDILFTSDRSKIDEALRRVEDLSKPKPPRRVSRVIPAASIAIQQGSQ